VPGVFAGGATALIELDAELRRLYAMRRRLARALACHAAAWLAGTAEGGLALLLMGSWPGLANLLMLESVIFALRTVASVVPGALGVQEAGYVFLGASLGIAPDIAMALALVKRARELLCGAPVLLLAQRSGKPLPL
jgi:hypothetical protein